MKHALASLALMALGWPLGGCNYQSTGTPSVSVPIIEQIEKLPAATDAAKGPATPSPFAGDRGAKLVEQLLKPSDQALRVAARKEREQRQLPAAVFLEKPQLPLPPFGDAVPRFPTTTAAKPVRPRPLAEGPPLDRDRADPVVPRRQEFVAQPIAVTSPDLKQPVPLPILAKPLADRAPLTDPTADVSVAAALAAPVPIRTNPAPFVRLNRPDPFENVQAIRLRTPVEEEPMPPVTIPRTPTK